jgi:O-antigen biosynthesis protein
VGRTVLRLAKRVKAKGTSISGYRAIPKVADLVESATIRCVLANGGETTSDRPPLSLTTADSTRPLFSIIIPNKNSALLMWRCLLRLYRTTDHGSTEVIVVDNDSRAGPIHIVYRYFAARYQLRIVEGCCEFNFSRLVNAGIDVSRGTHVILFNNDVFAIKAHWLEGLRELLELEGAAVVGATLLYPNMTIQHAGIVEAEPNRYEHIDRYARVDDFDRSLPSGVVGYSCLAVTGAVLMVRRSVWDALGGFDVAYPQNNGDVDFCLRAASHGGVFVSTTVRLVHLESVSRGYGLG